MKNKLFYIFVVFLLIITLLVHVCKNHILIYSYIHPNTNTECVKHIAKSIRILNNTFDVARISLDKEGIKIKYLYKNAYGSGFIKHNPIPNDLDYAIGIDLGEFEYTGDNQTEIADRLVETMNAYQLALVFHINSLAKDTIVSKETPIDHLDKLLKISNNNKKIITESLDSAIENKSYILHTKKDFKGNHSENGIEVAFIMEPGNILLEDRRLLKFFSNTVDYSGNTRKYMREISIIPEYSATIKHNNKKHKIFLNIEASLGGGIHLAEKLYVPQIFTDLNSVKFLKNYNNINNDEKYIYYRLFSFKSHLQNLNQLELSTTKPIKALKRLIQITDTIYPLLNDNDQKEIYDFAKNNLNNNSIILLNEYSNICSKLEEIVNRPVLFFDLSQTNEIKTMLKHLEEILIELAELKEISESDLKLLNNFYSLNIKKILEIKDEKGLDNIKTNILNNASFKSIIETVNDIIIKLPTYSPEKICKYNKLFNNILSEAGYHKITLYWFNNDTLGIISDDYTKPIKDLNDFAQKNDLINLTYKLIQPSEAPRITMRYDVYTKYNSTQKEEDNHKKLIKKLLDDKKNFKIKTRIIFY